jgi:hypothetical protein
MKVKWFVDALANPKRALAEKLTEPSEEQKIAWLIGYGKKPPRKTTIDKQFEGRTYHFDIGTFCTKLLRRSAAGSVSEQVLEQHAWYHDAARKFQLKQNKNTIGKVPIDTQIRWLIELGRRPTRNETIPKEYKGKDGPWRAGSFWYSVQGNWTGTRCNKLSPEWKRRLDPCVREWIAS